MKNIIQRAKTHLRDFFVNGVASSVITPSRIRILIYKFYGMDIKRAYIKPRCFFGSNKISIGEGAFINYGNFFDTHVSIGKNCAIGYCSVFASMGHEIGTADRRAGSGYRKPITVGDGTWIGSNVTVLPGVVIGEGCILAAGAVVTKDCSPHGLYAGVPAKRIKDLQV